MSDDEITLRELLAYAYAGASLYADDGELQDSRRIPFIDFLRDSPDDIAAKMRRRGKAALDAAGGERKILSDSARRAEIGALVEEMCRNGSLDGPLKIFPSRLADGPVRVSLAAFSGVRNGEAATLLEALRALAKEVSGE